MGLAILAQVGPIQLLAMFHFFLWLVAFGEHVSNSSSWHGHAESDRHQAALRPGRSRVEELHRAGRRPDGLLGSLPASVVAAALAQVQPISAGLAHSSRWRLGRLDRGHLHNLGNRWMLHRIHSKTGN